MNGVKKIMVIRFHKLIGLFVVIMFFLCGTSWGMETINKEIAALEKAKLELHQAIVKRAGGDSTIGYRMERKNKQDEFDRINKQIKGWESLKNEVQTQSKL